jgi:hypothetical protein
MERFRFLRRSEKLVAGNHLLRGWDTLVWFAPLDLVASASLSSLASALVSAVDYYGFGSESRFDRWALPAAEAELHVSHAPADEFDEDYSIAEPVSMCLLGSGQLVLNIEAALHGSDLDEDDLRPLVTPLLDRCSASFVAAGIEGAGSQAVCVVRVAFSHRGATVLDAMNLGWDVVSHLSQVRERDLTAESALDLLRAGRPDLLIGLFESPWLEAKGLGYDLSDDHGRIELAQDVARFANSDEAGLLVIGLRTRKRNGSDVIAKVTPSPDAFDAARYHRAIDAKLFPPVQGLLVHDLPVHLPDGRSGHILAIYVPRQPEETKPFLVHGAIVQGKVEGAFITIVQRRGEHSVPVTAATIHATLAAGRALLRRGELPGFD